MTIFSGRRLPVYLLLDTSASMIGAPIESVRQGLKAMIHDLIGDPMAFEIVHLAVITFDDLAIQVCPLTDVIGLPEPRLVASGSTALGAAIDVVIRSIQTEVRRSSPKQKGDYQPLIFILTDGQPTDDWQPAAMRLKALKLTVVACAAGPYANVEMLRQITDSVIELQSLEPGALRSFFRYVSDSIRAASQSVALPPAKPQLALPAPPPPPQV